MPTVAEEVLLEGFAITGVTLPAQQLIASWGLGTIPVGGSHPAFTPPVGVVIGASVDSAAIGASVDSAVLGPSVTGGVIVGRS